MNYLDILNKYQLYYEAGPDREIAEAVFNGRIDELDLEDPRVKSILAVYELNVKKNEEKFMELSKEVRASENMDAEFNLFNYVLKNKNYTLAENILGELERVKYRLPYVMLSYGYLYSDQDNIEKAIEYYLKAIEIGCEIANLNLASLYIRIKEYIKSIECLKTLNIDIPMTNYLLGVCYINIKNDVELDNILNNTNIGNYSELLRGYKLFSCPETIERGIEHFNIALELDDIMECEKENAFIIISNYYFEQEKYNEVIDFIKKNETYVNADIKFILGASYVKVGSEDIGYKLIYIAAVDGSERAKHLVDLVMGQNSSSGIEQST